jgi:predicted nucleic acid-binding protein
VSIRFLVDTNILSAAAPSKVQVPASLLEWMDRHSARLSVSVVTVAEIEDGIAKLQREGASRKANDLTDWLETLIHLYSARILPFDLGAARVAGKLSDTASSRGHAPGFADLAIAATAQQHGLTILTRNLKHFTPLGVDAYDPFARLPES